MLLDFRGGAYGFLAVFPAGLVFAGEGSFEGWIADCAVGVVVGDARAGDGVFDGGVVGGVALLEGS